MGVAKRKNAREKKRAGGFTVKRRAPKVKRGELLTDEVRSNWNVKKSLRKNFDSLGLAYDANAALEKYMDEVDPYLSPEEFEVEEDKGHLVEMLHVPPPNPKREKTLGPREQYYCKRLYDKHGLNFVAMARDRKENYWQYTPKQLEKQINLYLQVYKEDLEKQIEKKKNATTEKK